MKTGRQCFPKSARLRRRAEFVAVARHGRRVVMRHFVVLAGRDSRPGRVGITASRRVGGAVARNRVKRLVREAFRRHRLSQRLHRDLVVIARPGASELRYDAVAAELQGALRRLAPPLDRVG